MAAGFAHLGHEVIGVDKDAGLVAELQLGNLRVQEDGLPRLMAEGVAADRLRFTTSYEEKYPDVDFSTSPCRLLSLANCLRSFSDRDRSRAEERSHN